MKLVYPNTISTFSGDKKTAEQIGYVEISDQVFDDLVATRKKWENGNIVDDDTYESRMERQKKIEEDKNKKINNKKSIDILKAWFDVEYRQYNEKLQRFSALGINESIVDNFRNKEYKTLTDLYLEAEIVRKEIQSLE